MTRSLRASLGIVDSAPQLLRGLPARIIERLRGGEPRELIAGDLLVLYLSGPKQVSLLAVQHQKQAGYSFN